MSRLEHSPAARARYRRFAEFYLFYLSEHRSSGCRRLHFLGTALVLALLAAALLTLEWRFILAIPLAGYGCAWIGHFCFEHNQPATFSHPWYSLAGDFVLFRDMLRGRIKF